MFEDISNFAMSASGSIVNPTGQAVMTASVTIIIVGLTLYYQRTCRPYFDEYELGGLTTTKLNSFMYTASKHVIGIIGGLNLGMIMSLVIPNTMVRKASLFMFGLVLIFFASQVLFYFWKINGTTCPSAVTEISYGISIAFGYLFAGVGLIVGLLFDNVWNSIPAGIKAQSIWMLAALNILLVLIPSIYTLSDCKNAIADKKEGTQYIPKEGEEEIKSSIETMNYFLYGSMFAFVGLLIYIVVFNTSVEKEQEASEQVPELFVR